MDTTGKFANFFKASEEFSDKDRYAKHKQRRVRDWQKALISGTGLGCVCRRENWRARRLEFLGRENWRSWSLKDAFRANLKQR